MKRNSLKYKLCALACCLLQMGMVLAQESPVLLDTAIVNSIKITPEHIINTPNTEYSPVYYGDNIGYVYSSNRGRQVDKAIQEPFYDLGYAARDTSGLLALSASFSKEINSHSHEGPFAVNGENIYFTRVVTTKVNGKKGYTRKIYEGYIDGEEMAPLPFCTDEVSVCHPTLSDDGLTMIFSADMDDSGHMDLYQTSYIGDVWSTPSRLAGEVNTESHEFFPNIFRDSMLVFSSDRVGGYGGYDLYATVFRNGRWTAPQLVPEPLNSQWDDLGLIMRADSKKGYFTSNRPGGEGKDDIYSFSSIKPIIYKAKDLRAEVTFTVMDKLRFVPLSGVEIKITELLLTQDKLNIDDYNVDLLPGADDGELLLKLSPKKGKELPVSYSDNKGKYRLKLSPKNNYIITASSEGYETTTFVYSVGTYGDKLDIILEPKAAPEPVVHRPVMRKPAPVVKPPSSTVHTPSTTKPIKTASEKIFIPREKGAVVVFDNVYYGSNSVTLLSGSAKELDALADVMLLNAAMKVQLGAHTDSRGEANYNLMLSEERALSAKQYLIERGINPSRIKTRGYGESQVRNKCTNGTPCTQKEHEYNRRTEVKILKI